MSLNKTFAATLIALTAALLLNGCSGWPTGKQPLPVSTGGGFATGPDGGALSRPQRGRGPGKYRASDLNDPTSPLYKRTIYFEYDSSDIRPRFIAILRAHASYLSSDSTALVTLDGHADERGTREYNLALGYQRAGTLYDFLRAEGVPASRMRTMSYGEEHPANLGHSELSWALNRRVELLYREP